MKKIGIAAGIILAVIIIGIFLINVAEQDTEVTREKTKVGFVLNGRCDDGSWVQSHYEGMEKTAKMLNLDVQYRENVPETQESKRIMEELIADGCEIILCNSYQYGQYVIETAREHPEVYFFHAAGVETRKNVSTYFGRSYQMRYLSGIVAGMQTETDEIGYVAAFPIPEVTRGINAFTLGVRKANPDAKVHVAWCYSWNSDEKAENVTETLLKKHDIDVITIHTNSLAPLAVAQEKKIWSIGYNRDNSELYPDSWLTAPIWNWEAFYEPHILECLQKKFQSRNYWDGVETGLVDLAPFGSAVKPGIEEVVNEEKEKLAQAGYDVFYGPIRDRNGKLRVRTNENMSDDTLLHRFDWYVEGVVFE